MSTHFVQCRFVDGKPGSTCQLYENLHGGGQPLWRFDGSNVEQKEHVMCCSMEEMSEELLEKYQQQNEDQGRSSSDR